MWYLLHQQAQDIIAERHREADRRRLLRDATFQSSESDARLGTSAVDRGRITGARLALATSRLAGRIAVALDPAKDRSAVRNPTR